MHRSESTWPRNSIHAARPRRRGHRISGCLAAIAHSRLWHFCDIARLRMDFRFRWKSGRAADITASPKPCDRHRARSRRASELATSWPQGPPAASSKNRVVLNPAMLVTSPFQGEVWTLAQPLCRVARRSDAAYIGAMLIQRLVLLAALCALASPALAQPDPAADYPNHPVRIIVSTSAGGGVDTV